MSDPLTAIDLFAGAGGATQGLHQAGFVTLAAIESDPVAAASYAKNHPHADVYVCDVRDLDPFALRDELGLGPNDRLDLLKACPPCQGFSTLGSNDPDDPRNDLVFDVWRFIRGLRPRSFAVENVPGLASDGRFHLLLRRVRAIGYGVRSYIVDAAQFGVPQRRRRLVAIGFDHIFKDEIPDNLLDALPHDFDTSRRTAGEALDEAATLDPGADPVHRHRECRPATLARIRAIPAGGTRFALPPEHVLPCHERMQGRSATASYGRIARDDVAPTMTSRCTTPACGTFLHPTEDRGLTLREAALLQTFPIDYRFEGGYDQIERQIGNALPVRLAEAVGLIVSSLLAS